MNVHVGIVYPETPEWPKMRWVHDALASLGHRVDRAHGADGFLQLSLDCDVVVLGHKGISGRWPNIREAMKSRAAKVVSWWFDLIAYKDVPLEKQAYLSPDNHLPMLQAVDHVFVKERDLIHDFRKMGVNAHYLDQGCPIDARERVPGTKKWDVLLWGQGGPKYLERTKDIAALSAAGFKCAWATKDASPPPGVERLPWCHPDRLPELCGQAKCVLSVDMRHDVAGYTSDRFWMALGMGCCVLRRYSPGLPDGPYVVYRDRSELVERTRLALRGEAVDTPCCQPRASGLGKDARTWCMQNHTLAHRCQRLLEIARTARASAA